MAFSTLNNIRKALWKDKFIDNTHLIFGTDEDFGLTFDGTNLALKNSDEKTMFYFTNAGRMRNGTYTTPYALDAASSVCLSLYGEQTENEGVDAITFFFYRTTGDAGGIACSGLAEGTGSGDNYTATLEGGQFMAGLASGAKLKTRGDDTTAGMYGAWLKVYSAANCNLESGSYTAAVWLDNQHSANTNNGTEYTIYSTAGGTVPDAWAGLYSNSSGWTSLFKFEAAVAPLTDSSLSLSNQAGAITVVTPSGTRYIPLYSS